jgi:alkylation response protein AidB-like acyl-CoA dehydrogenase
MQPSANLHTAQLQNQGCLILKASMAKVYASETAALLQPSYPDSWGYGYISEYPVERYFRDAVFLNSTVHLKFSCMTIARQLIRG